MHWPVEQLHVRHIRAGCRGKPVKSGVWVATFLTSICSAVCLSSAGLLTLRKFGDSLRHVTHPLQGSKQHVLSMTATGMKAKQGWAWMRSKAGLLWPFSLIDASSEQREAMQCSGADVTMPVSLQHESTALSKACLAWWPTCHPQQSGLGAWD